MKFILGEKLKMSQIFDGTGKVVPVTIIKAGPCFITQLKTEEKDGYSALQFGYREKKSNKIKKTEKGKGFRYLREIKIEPESIEKNFKKIGAKIDVSIFKEEEKIQVSGISKGRGFQGVVKRWGFAGAPKSHGTKHSLRKPGSIGVTGPQRVLKGQKMAGRMGSKRVTIKNLKIYKIDQDNNLLYIKGAVPGRRGALLEIKTI